MVDRERGYSGSYERKKRQQRRAEIKRRISGIDLVGFEKLHTTPECQTTEIIKGAIPSGFINPNNGQEFTATAAILKCRFHHTESAEYWIGINIDDQTSVIP